MACTPAETLCTGLAVGLTVYILAIMMSAPIIMINPMTLAAVQAMAFRLTSSFFAAKQAVYVWEPWAVPPSFIGTGISLPCSHCKEFTTPFPVCGIISSIRFKVACRHGQNENVYAQTTFLLMKKRIDLCVECFFTYEKDGKAYLRRTGRERSE